MRDEKFSFGIGNGIILNIVTKNSRMLPPEVRDMLKDKSKGTGFERVFVLAFNPSGEQTYKPLIEQDAQKHDWFDKLKVSDRINSQQLWLGGKQDRHTITAYLVANEQSLMALTDIGILTSATVEEVRTEYRKIIESDLRGRA